MKLPSFPQTVKTGNSVVKIYRHKNGKYVEYKVAFYAAGARKMETFAEYQDAKGRADKINDSVNDGDANTLTLTGADRLTFTRAVAALEATGVPVDIAALQFAEAVQILGPGVSIVEAAQAFAKARQKAKHTDRTVTEVVEEFIKEKKSAKKSARYLYDLSYRLGKVKAAFSCNIASVDREIIQGFLTGLNLGARSYNNFRDALITLFRFAKKRNYVPADWNDLATVDAITDKGGAIEIFTPEELANLLTHADDKLIPFLTIGAFAGLRSAEICRLDWKSINFKTGFITVEAGHAKTAARRTIPITDNLRAWLQPRAKKKGLVWLESETALYWEIRELATDSKTAWKDNGLRHSFISYRVSESNDVNKTALEAGNSPAMIFRNYRALVEDPADAKRWFSIKPSTEAGKVIFLKAA